MQKFRTINYLKSFEKENKKNSHMELNLMKMNKHQRNAIAKKIQPTLLRARKNNKSITIVSH